MIRRGPGNHDGFTLLELAVALVIMAVLLALAVAGYRQYVQRVERAEAIRLILAVAACQERTRGNLGVYDTTSCLDTMGSSAYDLRIEPEGESSTNRYTIFAEPKISTGNTCGGLSLDHTGARAIGNEEGVLTDCWGGR